MSVHVSSVLVIGGEDQNETNILMRYEIFKKSNSQKCNFKMDSPLKHQLFNDEPLEVLHTLPMPPPSMATHQRVPYFSPTYARFFPKCVEFKSLREFLCNMHSYMSTNQLNWLCRQISQNIGLKGVIQNLPDYIQ